MQSIHQTLGYYEISWQMAPRKQIMDKPVNCILHPDSQRAYKLQYGSKLLVDFQYPFSTSNAPRLTDKPRDFIELQTASGICGEEHLYIHSALICCGGCPNLQSLTQTFLPIQLPKYMEFLPKKGAKLRVSTSAQNNKIALHLQFHLSPRNIKLNFLQSQTKMLSPSESARRHDASSWKTVSSQCFLLDNLFPCVAAPLS